MLPQWIVYILQSLSSDFIYVGSTRNLPRRFCEHAAGWVQSTKGHRPLKLVAYVAVETQKQARTLERYFKTGSGKAVLRKRILTDEARSSERNRS